MIRYTDTDDQISRLQDTIRKLSKWSGVDVTLMIDEGYLLEGDME